MEILNTRLGTVAIVGRPNVGKSTLFNRIIGRRKAVILDTPGMTRDRNWEIGDWNGRTFNVVDTGGYETEAPDVIYEQMREHSLLSVQEADVVVFLVDVKQTEHPVDMDVAEILRRAGKPVILAVNKCDNPKKEQESYAFYSMGFDPLFPISASNGLGTGELMDAVVEALPPESELEEPPELGVRIAVVGRPNVGKSSLVNAMLGRQRVITSDIPGTTRDTIDTTFRLPAPEVKEGEAERPERTYTLIDTAGLRRRGKIERGIEKLCAFSAEASIRRSDVALVLIDASQGLIDQDKHIAGFAHEAGRAIVLVVNKWDLIEKDNSTAGAFARDLRDWMGFVQYAPIIMVSAMTGQRVRKIFDTVDRVYEQYSRRIDTSVLNEWLQGAMQRLSPPWHKGRQLRIKYVTQVGVHPPTFKFFVNHPDLVHFSYERYLSNQLREAFGFDGTPLRLLFKPKSRKERD